MAGLGPAPFCAMMLADMGARVIRVDRADGADGRHNVLCRSRKSIAVDLKRTEGRAIVLDLLAQADALIEGFRPGVMERLHLGPDVCLQRNPRLVYGRMTGWGQEGPLALAAGHDINYISLAGVTHAIGPAGGAPVHPLNLVGDYGGGGMLLALGVMCGVWEAARSGRGQVIDAAMIDGASALMAEYYGFMARGEFSGPRGTHWLDGGAPFYGTYETADSEHLAIGPLEPKFYAELLRRLGLPDAEWQSQDDRSQWPARKQTLARLFRTRTLAEWRQDLEGTDACFSPVLPLAKVGDHPHVRARGTIIEVDGMTQPAPAPRFSRTPAAMPERGRAAGEDSRAVLEGLGLSAERIEDLLARGIVHQT
jgi:alpha-methylacyl-CoA racemase